MASHATKRDKPFIVQECFMYRYDKRSADDGKFWRCLKDGCSGRVKTVLAIGGAETFGAG